MPCNNVEILIVWPTKLQINRILDAHSFVRVMGSENQIWICDVIDMCRKVREFSIRANLNIVKLRANERIGMQDLHFGLRHVKQA